MTQPTRILLLNPNTTQAITDRLLRSAQAVAAPGTVLDTPGTPTFGTLMELGRPRRKPPPGTCSTNS